MLIEGMGGLGNPVVSEPEFTRRETKLLTGEHHAQITCVVAGSDITDCLHSR